MGLDLVEAEEVAKTIGFEGWVARQGLGPATRLELATMLEEAPAGAAELLRPRIEHGERTFDLREGIFVARNKET